ncbi:MAG: methylated-DNA--[protein]-cysteine S-methyltransferase [Planctomycetaceae bacterium]
MTRSAAGAAPLSEAAALRLPGNPAVFLARSVDTPLGCLELLAGPRGLRAVRFPGERPAARRRADARRAGAVGDAGPGPVDPAACLLEAARQLSEYFAGERTVFELPLDPVGTPFQRAAWEVLRTIPFGRTISYGEQAARLGAPNAARAVGAANGRNPLPVVVPCHRVVGRDGSLVGFAAGTAVKAWLVRHEGIVLPGTNAGRRIR